MERPDIDQGDVSGQVELPDGVLRVIREIPLPASVSEEARAVLQFGTLLSSAAPVPPSLDDTAGWKAHVAEMDGIMVSALGPQAIAADVTASVTSVGGVPLHVVEPSSASIVDGAPIYLDIHGGGLVFGGGEACRVMSVLAAERSGLATWSPDYRMPPDHPFPAALDDCFAVYRRLLDERDPGRIVVGGGSAGGNLAAALLLRARSEGLPMPAALVLMTPEIDLTESGDSFETNLGVDTVLTARLTDLITLYADGADLTDPLLSPLFADPADLAAFPPTFLQTGTRDLFLSNTVRMHRALRQAGVEAELHVFEAMPHGGFFGGTPEDHEVVLELRRFLNRHVG